MYPALSDLAAVDSDVSRYPYDKSGDVLSPGRVWADIREQGRGACSNYATAKIRLLHERGWPIELLLAATVWVEPFLVDGRPATLDERYHAIAVVSTPEDGYWCLCNRQLRPFSVLAMKDLGYEPHEIQEVGGSMTFVKWFDNKEVVS